MECSWREFIPSSTSITITKAPGKLKDRLIIFFKNEEVSLESSNLYSFSIN